MAYPRRTAAQNREYWAIKNALTRAEKELISFYELNWFLKNQYVPSVEEVTAHLKKQFPKIKHTSVSYYLQRKPVMKALEKRGIPWERNSHEDLTPTQIAVAVTMANFADTRSNAEKLDSMGINETQYYAWLQDPKFQNYVQSMADQNLKNIDPVAKVEFAKKIQEGNWAAIRFYLETTGGLQTEEGPDPKQQMLLLIEIIQRHVKDSSILEAIAHDVDRLMRSRTSEVLALEGEVILPEEDEELQRAIKQVM